MVVALVLVTSLFGRFKAVSASHPNSDLEIQVSSAQLPGKYAPMPGRVPDEDEIVLEWLQNPGEYTFPLLLPDLQSLPAFDIHLELNTENGTLQIRFSNSIGNSGVGPLEMDGAITQEPSLIDVAQNIYRTDGTHYSRDAGAFYYDREHGHWHWEGFSAYEVWSVDPNGVLSQRLANNQKVGYCIIDVSIYDLPKSDQFQFQALNRPDYRQYTNCESTRQGLSVGWIDTYKYHLPGQFVDVTHLANGIYALRATVDPINIIHESDESNNSSLVYFLLIDQQLYIINSADIHTGGIFHSPQ